MAFRIFVVSGKFLLPGGSRKQVELPPTKVIAETRQQASKDLVSLLNEKFAKELARGVKSSVGSIGFGADFALCQLKWDELMPKSFPTPKDKALAAVLRGVAEQPALAMPLQSATSEP